jgi:hypothetical protein
MASAANPSTPHLGLLLRGEPLDLCEWLNRGERRRLVVCFATILIGAGSYGAAMGFWRAPIQGLYVAIKFPIIILLTTFANSLLNAMIAPLLGLNISLRQSFLAVLLSFTIVSAILGAFSPLAAFVIWNAPPLSSASQNFNSTYSFIQLMHVGVIAFAGIVGNLRLYQLLRQLSGTAAIARRVLFAWLAGNFIFGSQLSWILRPFIGSPGLDVDFLRKTAFQGNFYETVFRSILAIFTHH